jgi:hypothetical protein
VAQDPVEGKTFAVYMQVGFLFAEDVLAQLDPELFFRCVKFRFRVFQPP